MALLVSRRVCVQVLSCSDPWDEFGSSHVVRSVGGGQLLQDLRILAVPVVVLGCGLRGAGLCLGDRLLCRDPVNGHLTLLRLLLGLVGLLSSIRSCSLSFPSLLSLLAEWKDERGALGHPMARLATAEANRAAEVSTPASSFTLWSSSALVVFLATAIPLASLVALASLATASVSLVVSLGPPTLVPVVVVLAVLVLGLSMALWGRRLSLGVEACRCHGWHCCLRDPVGVWSPVRKRGGCYGCPGGRGGA